MEGTKNSYTLDWKAELPKETNHIEKFPLTQRVENESLSAEKVTSSTGALLEAERIVFKKELKEGTYHHKYSPDKASLIINILDAPDNTIKTQKNELQEILRAAQNEFETIVEFKGRIVAISEEVAEITIYEEGRNETYTNLDPAYLTDIGLSQGDSFVLSIVNDHGIEVPVFKPDKDEMEKVEEYLGPKSEKSSNEAMQSQKDLDELSQFLKNDESKR